MRHMKQKPFHPSWFAYPSLRIATIVISESELAEQEATIGNGEYLREATKNEVAYQESGIPTMVVEYHSIISGAPIETTDRKNTGIAS